MKIIKIVVLIAIILLSSDELQCSSILSGGLMNVLSATEKVNLRESASFFHPSLNAMAESSYLSAFADYSGLGIAELSPMGAVFCLKPSDRFNASANIVGVGTNLYNEFQGQLSAVYSFGQTIHTGIGGGFSKISILDYGVKYEYNFLFSSLMNISNGISAGFAIQKLVSEDYPGTRFIAGIGYSPFDFLGFDVSANVNLNRASGICVSAKYSFSKYIHTGVHVLTNPQLLVFDVKAYASKNLGFNFGLSFHERLGFSESTGLFWYF